MKKLTKLQVQVRETIEKLESLKTIQSHLTETKNGLKQLYGEIRSMDKQLDKELKDIEKLERVGVRSLFHKTLGTKEAQLEKERQEYLELSLKHKELKKEIALLEYEKELLTKKIRSIKEVEKKLTQLKKEREKELKNNLDPQIRQEFRSLLETIDFNHALRREIEEAHNAGAKCLKILEKVIALLKNAGEWGRWDMYGDKRRSEYMKHRSLDQALKNIPVAQHNLNLFKKELADLGEKEVVLQLDNVHFNKFRDFFFDNLISDWIVQQRIKNTLNNVEATHSHVRRIIMSLEQEFKLVNKKIQELDTAKDKMIMS